MILTPSQSQAIAFITNYAKSRSAEAKATVQHILRMSDISQTIYEAAKSQLFSHARVALHFHPDRPDPDMKSVSQALLEQGLYKSQFETLLSNGSVSAYPGGARDTWEQRLFGGAYQIEGVTNDQRPKYGSLDLMLHADGPSPRFGSCFFLLKPEVSRRCTFTYLDSYQDPPQKGTYEAFEDILAGLLSDSFSSEIVIGEEHLRPPALVEHLLHKLGKAFLDPSARQATRNLDHYIEAQIHGNVSLQQDVDILVADPSFQHTEIGDVIEQIARTYRIELYWHMGFSLRCEEVPQDFRGPTMPSLAKRVAPKGLLTPYLIGKAAMLLKQDPVSWSNRGSYKEVLQELKLLWHVLVKYGEPLAHFSQHR